MARREKEDQWRPLSEVACEWIVRLRDGDVTPADQKEYVEWLKRSPEHIAEMLKLIKTFGTLRGSHRRTERAEEPPISPTVVEELVASPRRIHLPPAHLLITVAQLVLSRTAYVRYVEPTILDMRLEHYEALQVGDFHRARWVVARGYLSVCWPFLVGLTKTVLRWFTA